MPMPAFRVQDYGPLPETPDIIRAPELTFYELSNGQVEKEWGLHSDVWSMACMVWSPFFWLQVG
jgi:serine/threonine-protein kinase SRPK3